MARLIGLDVGTTGTKGVLIDEHCMVLAEAFHGYPLHTPQDGWAEQDPADWEAAARDCLSELGEADCYGLTGQMHGAAFLDVAGEPVCPAPLWCDQRTGQQVREMEKRLGTEAILRITGNPMLTGFQAPKILWLQQERPELWRRTRRVLLPKDYVRLKLFGGLGTDANDANGTGLLDISSRDWSAEMLEALSVAPEMLPRVFEQESKVPGDAATAAGGGDQACAAIGTGLRQQGDACLSLGTSGVIFGRIPEPVQDADGAAHQFCYIERGYHGMSVMLSCGGAIDWASKALGFDSVGDLEAAARSVEGSEGLTFLPYLAGERTPHADPNLRASFRGIGLGHTRSHMARAVFEGVSFGMRDGLEALVGLGLNPGRTLATGGGVQSEFWLQLLADALEVPVAVASSRHGPALGAAILAGVAEGVWPDVATAQEQLPEPGSEFLPSARDYAAEMNRFHGYFGQSQVP